MDPKPTEHNSNSVTLDLDDDKYYMEIPPSCSSSTGSSDGGKRLVIEVQKQNDPLGTQTFFNVPL